VQNRVTVPHSPCRQRSGQRAVELRQIGGLDVLEASAAEMLPGIVQAELIAMGARRRRVQRDPIALEPVQEIGQRDSRRIDGRAALDLGDQPRAFDLR